MFTRDIIMPPLEQATAMLEIFNRNDLLKENGHHHIGFLKWAIDQLTASDNVLPLPKLYEVEDAIRAAINTAFGLSDPMGLVHNIDVDTRVIKAEPNDVYSRVIKVRFHNVFSRQSREGGDAYDTLIKVAISEPDSIHFQAIEWLKRNDYPGFRSALSGEPRENFADIIPQWSDASASRTLEAL